MIEQHVRRYYQTIFVDAVAAFLVHRIKPNTMTWIAGLWGILVIPALLFNQVSLTIAVLLISGYCDTLDGTLARMSQHTTRWGTVLDITMDRVVEFSVVLALYLVAPLHHGLWCFLMLGSMLLCVTSFLVVGIFMENDTDKSFHYSPGIMERPEAFAFFIAMMLWPSAFVYLAVTFTLLVTATALIRLYQFYTQAQYNILSPLGEKVSQSDG
ncbi:MAG: CDP-alcohol phosphatidyltransferase family protein [Gammaproteobacteria bacterium]|nr:CDP-alcohol phosphatidyltransferase family protein [Gammaproteobacteria bacterium]